MDIHSYYNAAVVADRFGLRWFTPRVEVPLCGHATLASAAVLFHCIGLYMYRAAGRPYIGPLHLA